MRSFTLGFVAVALSATLARGASPNEKLGPTLEKIRLATDLPVNPGPANLVGSALYFSERSELPQCAGKDLYRIEAKVGKVEKVASVDCVVSLQAWDGKLFVERRANTEDPKAPVFLGALVDKKIVPAENLALLWPQISLSLYGLGTKTDAKIGSRLRQSTFRSVAIDRRGDASRVFYLAEKPRSLPDFPDFVIGQTELGEKAKPETQFIGTNKNEVVTTLLPGEFPNAFALSHLLGEEEFSFLRLDVTSGKITERNERLPVPSGVRYLRKLEYLTVTRTGAAIYFEPGDQKTVAGKIWLYDPKDKSTEALELGSRDVLGIAGSDDGVLISRRSGIDWYGPKGKLADGVDWTKVGSASLAPAGCGPMKIVRQGKAAAEVFTLLKGEMGETEFVSLGIFEGLEQIECTKQSIVAVSASFRLNLLPNHLKLGIVPQGEEKPTATNFEAATKVKEIKELPSEGVRISVGPTQPSLLFHLSGDTLKLVRAPFSGVRFSKLSQTNGKFTVEQEDTVRKEPYAFNLSLNADGTGVVSRYPEKPAKQEGTK